MTDAEAQLARGDTIVSVTVGSRLFGTNTPASDMDFIHIYRPHLKRLILGHNDQPAQSKMVGVEDTREVQIEHTYWTIQHFFKLLAQGQTQALEIMFSPIVHVGHPATAPTAVFWKDFKKEFDSNRKKWISKNTAAFVGYCKSQANKYSVKGERLEAVKGLLSALKAYKQSDLIKDTSLLANIPRAKTPYLSVESIFNGNMYMPHINCCNVKCPDHFTVKQGIDIYQRLYTEYGKRAQAAMGNGAIDWKALSHAARVTIEAKELLTDHTITLPLKKDDREYVKAIKAGLVPHSEVVEFLDTGLATVEYLRETCSLAESVDRQLYDDWLLRAYKGEKVA